MLARQLMMLERAILSPLRGQLLFQRSQGHSLAEHQSLLFQRRWQAKPDGGFLYARKAVDDVGKGNPQSAPRPAPFKKEPKGIAWQSTKASFSKGGGRRSLTEDSYARKAVDDVGKGNPQPAPRPAPFPKEPKVKSDPNQATPDTAPHPVPAQQQRRKAG